MEVIDVHSHLQGNEFDNDRADVIESAKECGVTKIIISALDTKDMHRAIEVFKSYKDIIYITIGCAPYNLEETGAMQDLARKMRDKIIGIGEVGLDFYRGEETEHMKQREIFKSWIRLAKEMDLPLIIHSRSAGKYAIEMLIEEGYYKILMHAYDGKVGWALKGAEKGFYFSIPPSVVYSEQKQKLVKTIGINNLMLESDAPVLGPEKDKRNEPSNLKFVIQKITEIKGLNKMEVVNITTKNAVKFFGFGKQ